ncbi:hypothetical protein B7P43_G01072 [Cryptotermes secundus]|uniref:Uncharacterized protein n=1 Tax=Cryptotermes secundus TaxID=105785 RepID=A0A2J7Q570_9NEOP|nr:hypothetical protein B7P43_G01072 [Cryptotermes secundus]
MATSGAKKAFDKNQCATHVQRNFGTKYGLKQRIREGTATVDEAMLGRVWQEFDYRVDVCRVTRVSHVERLRGKNKLSEFLFKMTRI